MTTYGTEVDSAPYRCWYSNFAHFVSPWYWTQWLQRSHHVEWSVLKTNLWSTAFTRQSFSWAAGQPTAAAAKALSL
eukprot:639788-Amphidinium_carterae.1